MISVRVTNGSLPRVWKPMLFCLAALMLSTPTFGFCFEPQPTVACEFLDSQAVFVGTVISTETTPSNGYFDEGWTYELNVQKLYRGPNTKTIKVFTANNSARFPLDNGQKYVLFVSMEQGRLVVYGCGNSALFSRAQETIKQLDKLKIPNDAEIEGRISFEVEGGTYFSRSPNTSAHVNRVHVVITSHQKTYTATTDREGWFHLRVSPGAYSADVQPIAHWTIHPFDLSIDDPDHFEARKGHCSGLQFVASPK
jgi:hypothetical protein